MIRADGAVLEGICGIAKMIIEPYRTKMAIDLVFAFVSFTAP
jgi:hypothetical protein